MFRPVPDVDWVYCGEEQALLHTRFIETCHEIWTVVHTATTWGEFIDRLATLDDELVDHMCPDGVESLFSADGDWGLSRDDAFTVGALESSGLMEAFPFGGGTHPYRTWESDLPNELWELCETGSSMAGGDYCYLPSERIPDALQVIAARGETSVEDCELIEELGRLYNVGREQS